MTVQFRPRDGISQAMYSPDRDPAYTGLPMLRAVLTSLEEEHWDQWLRDYFAFNKVTADDLAQAARCLGKFVEMSCDPAIDSVQTALEKSGLANLPFAAPAILFLKLGQRQLGAIFSALRQTTPQGSGPPLRAQEVVEAAESAAKHLIGKLMSRTV